MLLSSTRQLAVAPIQNILNMMRTILQNNRIEYILKSINVQTYVYN